MWPTAATATQKKTVYYFYRGNEKYPFERATQRISPSRILYMLLLFSVTLAPIYIGRIFKESRPDASIGSEISMPTYQA